MIIKFLGTSFGAPSAGRHQQSILLETDIGNAYLLDAGAPVLDILVNENYDLKKIKGIFLSHMHGDHIDGIFDIIYLAQYFQMKYDLYVPDKSGLHFLKSYMELQNIRNCDWITYDEIKEGLFYDDGNVKVNAVRTNHMSESEGNSYGFIIEHEDKKIYISGDLHSSLNDFPDFADDEIIDMAIVECAHFDAKTLINKLSEYRINKAAVIHVMPEEKYTDLKRLSSETNVKIILPDDGDIIKL